MMNWFRLGVLLVLCLVSTGASSRTPQKKVTPADFGVPTYPGVKLTGAAPMRNQRHFSFSGRIPRNKVKEVFNFYNASMKSKGWVRNDNYGTSRTRRRLKKENLSYAFFQRQQPDLTMSLFIFEPGGSSRRRKKNPSVDLMLAVSKIALKR